jgi:predicted SnoaL-like aldol condensation-catalyzing enzyme
MPIKMNSSVERYFDAMDRHDWRELRGCLSDSFGRVGPYEEHVWDDPDGYVAFLQDLLPTLKGQMVEITEVIEQGRLVHVNLTETIEVKGSPQAVRVAGTFRLSPSDQIEHIEVFVRRFPPMPTPG